MRRPGVAVIVVNYGTAALAAKAVRSVLAQDDGARGIEVHLVDNASPGGDAATLRALHQTEGWGPRVTLWPEPENHGFGRGNNLVLEALEAREDPPDFVFLLNPDAWLENAAIPHLVEALKARPGAGAAGAALVGPDGARQAAAFRFPTAFDELLRVVNFGPLSRMFGYEGRVLDPGDETAVVEWVSGASVMFRMAALREVGGFDPGFFLYYEEVELMHRLGRAGWKTLHVPQAYVGHAEGAATGGGGRRPDQPGYVYDSWRLYHLLTAGRGPALLLALAMMPAAALNVLICALRGRRPTIPRGFFRHHWQRVVWPLLAGARV